MEKVIDVPASGAEGTVRLAPMVTQVTVYMRSGRTMEGELVSRIGDKIKVKRGKGSVTLRPDQYEKIAEREAVSGESSIQLFGPGQTPETQIGLLPVHADLKTKLGRKITLDFAETPLQDVMQFISGCSGVNIVVGPRAKMSEVTVRLTDVPLEDALKVIAGITKTRLYFDGTVLVFLGHDTPTTRLAPLRADDDRVASALALAPFTLHFADTPINDIAVFLSECLGKEGSEVRFLSSVYSNVTATFKLEEVSLGQQLKYIALVSKTRVSFDGNTIGFSPNREYVRIAEGVIDDFGSPHEWKPQSWADPVQVTPARGPTGAALRLTFKPAGHRKAVVQRSFSLDLSKAESISLRVSNRSSSEVSVALGLNTKNGKEYLYETKPVPLAPNASRDVRFPLKGRRFKSDTTGWQFGAQLANANRTTALSVFLYAERQATVEISYLRAVASE